MFIPSTYYLKPNGYEAYSPSTQIRDWNLDEFIKIPVRFLEKKNTRINIKYYYLICYKLMDGLIKNIKSIKNYHSYYIHALSSIKIRPIQLQYVCIVLLL